MRLRPFLPLSCLAAFAVLAPVRLAAQNAPAAAATPDSYRLMVRDQVEIAVFGQISLSTTQRIDANGQVKLNLLDTVVLAGRTVRESEDLLETLYVENRLLREPIVTIRVVEYAPREVLVNGAVASPGAFSFPPETSSVDIVEVIIKCGGFTPIARKNTVKVNRFTPAGPEGHTVPVHDMMIGRKKEKFFVQPGDIIFVDEVLM